ncbi:hypothetical protein CGC21_28055 [Leishmania donovani]|uniref:Uncharacterized protein n=2 Tax=Leishmania donovani TaxID=5661 RepID=A0A504XVT5_LEIDO|nr:hypothetical protein CGC21_28055 [Leishmania donovani]
MSLAVGPEVMRVVAAKSACHPMYATRPASDIHVKVCIDSIQRTGGRQAMETALQAPRIAAEKLSVTSNDDETGTCNMSALAGVALDHNLGTVCGGKQTCTQLSTDSFKQLTRRKSWDGSWVGFGVPPESCTCPLTNFVFSSRRRAGSVRKRSRGLHCGSSWADLPQSAQSELRLWRQRAAPNVNHVAPHAFRRLPQSTAFT